jgi:rRNA maturation endonuclease Nob1
MSCKNICIDYIAKKSYQSSYYEDGLKRCTQCEVFIRWNKTRCPCCGVSLRIKARDARIRRKLKIQKFSTVSYTQPINKEDIC